MRRLALPHHGVRHAAAENAPPPPPPAAVYYGHYGPAVTSPPAAAGRARQPGSTGRGLPTSGRRRRHLTDGRAQRQRGEETGRQRVRE